MPLVTQHHFLPARPDYLETEDLWIGLLAGILKAAKNDSIEFRRIGFIDDHGNVTAIGKARLGRRGHLCTEPLKDYDTLRALKELGRFTYQGGVDELMAFVGGPPIGARFVKEIEEEVSRL